MKKIILIILMCMLFSSCNKYIVTNIYEQKYINHDIAYSDVYDQLYKYDLDSIPMQMWISNTMTADTTLLEQKSIIKTINNKSNYSFVFSKYVYPSSMYYSFLIRFTGNKKDLK